MFIEHDGKEIKFKVLKSIEHFRFVSKEFVPIKLHWLPMEVHERKVPIPFLCTAKDCILCEANELVNNKAMLVQNMDDKEIFITLVSANQQMLLCQEASVLKVAGLYGKQFSQDTTDARYPFFDIVSQRVAQVTQVSKGWTDKVNEMFYNHISTPDEGLKAKLKSEADLKKLKAIELEEAEKARKEMKTFVVNRHAERFPTGYRNQQEDKANKGLLGGSCNVNACQLEGQAVFYNRHMNAFYCWGCAVEHHHSSRHREIQTYDPNIFDLCQSQGYTLTLEQAEGQRNKSWVTTENINVD